MIVINYLNKNEIGGTNTALNNFLKLLKNSPFFKNIIYIDKNIDQHNFGFLFKILSLRHQNYYFNSFFSPITILSIFYLMLISCFKQIYIVISPRGELSSDALKQKHFKKIISIFIIKLILKNNVVFICSNKNEKKNTANIFKKQKCYLIEDVYFPSNPKLPTNKNKILFYSRIDRIKNIDFILNLYLKFKISIPLDIYGPIIDKKYWARCCDKINKVNIKNKIINYKGSVSQKKKFSVLKKYKIFILPSKSENFNYTVLEAIDSGCYIICSKNLNNFDLKLYNNGTNLDLKNKELWSKTIEKIYNNKNLFIKKKINHRRKKFFNKLKYEKVLKKYIDVLRIN